nr:ThuA domain-containing protein [Auraticoccus cholistanensis]
MFIPHLEASGYRVRVETTPEVYADAAAMAEVDLVVQCYTMGQASKEAVAGLRRAVAAGTGFAGWHGGIADSFRASSDYLQLVGGQFATHPPQDRDDLPEGPEANYIPYTVDITVPDHPVTAGIGSFDLVTEQYWVLTDDYNDVLATTTLAARDRDEWHRPITCPAVWTRRWGRGSVFVCTPGHTVEVLQHPSVRTIVERGLLWASR